MTVNDVKNCRAAIYRQGREKYWIGLLLFYMHMCAFVTTWLCAFIRLFCAFSSVKKTCGLRFHNTSDCVRRRAIVIAGNYTVSGKKVTPCVLLYNSGKWCRILTKFGTNNATSNCKQTAKFQWNLSTIAIVIVVLVRALKKWSVQHLSLIHIWRCRRRG